MEQGSGYTYQGWNQAENTWNQSTADWNQQNNQNWNQTGDAWNNWSTPATTQPPWTASDSQTGTDRVIGLQKLSDP